MEVLLHYDWPGNVRELENVIGRAMINMRLHEKVIEIEHLPLLGCEKINQAFFITGQGSLRTLDQAVSEAERTAIVKALSEAGGNRQKAAALLDTALRNLYYKIKKYAID